MGEPVRVVQCSHLTCGHQTRVRLPGALPAEAVRCVVCGGCGRTFECHMVQEVDESAPRAARSAREWLEGRPGHLWQMLSIPIAAAAVIGVLLLIRALGG